MPTRDPARVQLGHLMWTTNGTVWATWKLSPLPYGFSPLKQKNEARDYHQALLRALPGESLLLGVCATLDPAAVVERMFDGVDLDECQAWAAECAATLDSLEDLPLGERMYFLTVPLGDSLMGLGKSKESLRSSAGSLRERVGLPAASLPPGQIARRLEQARQIQASIPAPFSPAPVTAAQMAWLQLHAQRRGLGVDPGLPVSSERDITARSGRRVSESILDEGGLADLENAAVKRFLPTTRRYLKVTSPGDPGEAPCESYQALTVLSDVPARIAFPNGEIIGRIDESGIETDWALRLHVKSQDAVAAANKKALNNLNDQYRQREGDTNLASDAKLGQAAADLAEYIAVLTSDELEVEVQATWILATAAADPVTATDQSRDLAAFLSKNGFKVAAPIGFQKELWWSMTPGAPTTRIVREYAQLTTSRDMSALVPLAGTELGDRKGSLWALNITSGRLGVVFHDTDGHSERDGSGCMAFGGEPGGGKSYGMKTLTLDALDRDANALIVDPTPHGEWEETIRPVENSVIVNVAEPEYSLDPIRVFGPDLGCRIARSFLTTLLNIKPMSPLGGELRTVLSKPFMKQHGLAGLGDVLEFLLSDQTAMIAPELAERMQYFAGDDYGQVIFDKSLPPMPLTAKAIVIRTSSVELPTEKELDKPHLFDQLPGEKIFGRALYALIAWLAKEFCFADRNSLSVFVVEEVHTFMISPEGALALEHFNRHCRKHDAVMYAAAQDPFGDLGSEAMKGLFPARALFRQTDENLAIRSLKWMGLDHTDPDLIDLVMYDLSPKSADGVPLHRRGEHLFRDVNNTVGKAKTLGPALPARAKAILTTPDSKKKIRNAVADPELQMAGVG